MYYVYILFSEKDGKLYIGSAPDLRKRLEKHKKGFVNATKNRHPLKLIYYECYLDKHDAQRRERVLERRQRTFGIKNPISKYFQKNPIQLQILVNNKFLH
jgi:putative endonuclease